MPEAVWSGAVIAESDDTVIVEGNHYFPAESVHRSLLVDSAKQSVCPWKGTAGYHDLVVDGQTNPGAAWSYPEPRDAAAEIKGHVAFWRGVSVGP